MNRESTLPKPFVFVLMPFDEKFSDIYKFGIKGAAEDVGAYAERIDEQIFTEGILDRIFTQISKADVVVADMTGRNPNVFYEVGYAHALGKTTLLLTQSAEDIPFDLKHRQHIVYGGKIDGLRRDLGGRLRWAVEASRRDRGPFRSERLALFVLNVEAAKPSSAAEIPTLDGQARSTDFSIPIQLRNDSMEALSPITHVYLLSKSSAALVPTEGRTWTPAQATGFTYLNTLPLTTPFPLDPLSAGLLDKAGDLRVSCSAPAGRKAMTTSGYAYSLPPVSTISTFDFGSSSRRIRTRTTRRRHLRTKRVGPTAAVWRAK